MMSPLLFKHGGPRQSASNIPAALIINPAALGINSRAEHQPWHQIISYNSLDRLKLLLELLLERLQVLLDVC